MCASWSLFGHWYGYDMTWISGSEKEISACKKLVWQWWLHSICVALRIDNETDRRNWGNKWSSMYNGVDSTYQVMDLRINMIRTSELVCSEMVIWKMLSANSRNSWVDCSAAYTAIESAQIIGSRIDTRPTVSLWGVLDTGEQSREPSTRAEPLLLVCEI